MIKGVKIAMACGLMLLAASCNTYNKAVKSYDNDLKYEIAKANYVEGNYGKTASLLEDVVMFMKGTGNAEESLFLTGMVYFKQKDYVTSPHYFKTYYTTFPRGVFCELARFYSGKAMYLASPEPKLDQNETYRAIQELQMFLEYFPDSRYKNEAQQMQFALQDKLVYKEYLAAKLYYDLGNYMGNNYLSCIITAQNALKDYPYTNLREELAILVLRSRYQMAAQSVESKQEERYREAVDEYYAFKNDYPDSKYMREATTIFENSQKHIKD